MDIPTHSELLGRIETFCRRHDMAESRFGREAVNNPAFIGGLRRDPPVSPTLETLNRITDFMARVDRDAPPPPLELTAPPSEEDVTLPFGTAPVTDTGASSPISSSTTAPPPSPAASASSPTCSCSADESAAAAEARAA